jgi:hypothetical protein
MLHHTVKNDSWNASEKRERTVSIYNPRRQQNSARVSLHNCKYLWHVYIQSSVTIIGHVEMLKSLERKTSLDNNDVEREGKNVRAKCATKVCVIKFIVLQLLGFEKLLKVVS